MSALLHADEEPLRVNASDQPETGYAALPTFRPAQLCVTEAPVGAPAAAPVGAGASGSGGDAPAAAEGAVGSSAGELPRQIARAWSVYALATHATGRNRHAVRPPAYWQSAVDRRAPPVGAPAALLSQGGAGWGWARDRWAGAAGAGRQAGQAGGTHRGAFATQLRSRNHCGHAGGEQVSSYRSLAQGFALRFFRRLCLLRMLNN